MLDKKHISATVMPSFSSSFSGSSAKSALSTRSWLSLQVQELIKTRALVLNISPWAILKKPDFPSRLVPRWRSSLANRNGNWRFGSFRQHHVRLQGASRLLLLSCLMLLASLLLRPKADATDEKNDLSVSCLNSNQTGAPLVVLATLRSQCTLCAAVWKVFSPNWPWPSLEGATVVCASRQGHVSDFKPDQSCLQSDNTQGKCAENNFPCKKMVPSVKDDIINQNHSVTESSWPLSIHHIIPIRRGVYGSTKEHLIFTVKMRWLSYHSFNDPHIQHAAF